MGAQLHSHVYDVNDIEEDSVADYVKTSDYLSRNKNDAHDV